MLEVRTTRVGRFATKAERSDNPRLVYIYECPDRKKTYFNLVNRAGSRRLYYDGVVDKVRIRSRVGRGHVEADLHDPTRGGELLLDIEREIVGIIRRTLTSRGKADDLGGTTGDLLPHRNMTYSLTLGAAFDYYREHVMPETGMRYRRSLDVAMRQLEAYVGRGVKVMDISKSTIQGFVETYTSRSRPPIAAPDRSPDDPERAYLWPHPTRRSLQRNKRGGQSGAADRVRALYDILQAVKDEVVLEGHDGPVRPLVVNPVKIEWLPPREANSARPTTTKAHYDAMLRVADKVEEAGKPWRDNLAWPQGGVVRTMLFAYWSTGRRQNPIRLWQRKNILLTPEAIAERLRAMKWSREDATKAARNWRWGAIWYEGWKDKGTPFMKRLDAVVPMNASQFETLARYVGSIPDQRPDAWLFPSPTCTPHLHREARERGAVDQSTQRSWLSRARVLGGLISSEDLKLEEEGESKERYGFHAFRRAVRVRLHFNGVSGAEAALVVGWKLKKDADEGSEMVEYYLQRSKLTREFVDLVHALELDDGIPDGTEGDLDDEDWTPRFMRIAPCQNAA
jgi:hypothetical protein